MSASRSTRGCPAVPDTTILIVWVPDVAQAFAYTMRRKYRLEAWRLIVATPTPSITTRADPRVGPRPATHAIPRPVNVRLMDAPAAFAYVALPFDHDRNRAVAHA